jgi:hypothetical protein
MKEVSGGDGRLVEGAVRARLGARLSLSPPPPARACSVAL